MASGDDVVIVGDPKVLKQIRFNALKLTNRSKKDTVPKGLGQVVE